MVCVLSESITKPFPSGACPWVGVHVHGPQVSLLAAERCLGGSQHRAGVRFTSKLLETVRKSSGKGRGRKDSKGLKKALGVQVLFAVNLHGLCEVIFKQSTPVPSYSSSFQIPQALVYRPEDENEIRERHQKQADRAL